VRRLNAHRLAELGDRSERVISQQRHAASRRLSTFDEVPSGDMRPAGIDEMSEQRERPDPWEACSS